jgi:hypothetical protein
MPTTLAEAVEDGLTPAAVPIRLEAVRPRAMQVDRNIEVRELTK